MLAQENLGGRKLIGQVTKQNLIKKVKDYPFLKLCQTLLFLSQSFLKVDLRVCHVPVMNFFI